MSLRKLFSILLISLLLLNFAGLLLYFPLQLFRIHLQMKMALKNLPDEKLEVFSFSRNDFNKAKVDDDEIKINGKMFDIARRKVQGDTIIIYALHDKAEDNLLAFLDEIVKPASHDRSSPPTQIVKFITLTFLTSIQNYLNYFESSAIELSTAYLISDFFYSPSIESPPPRG